MIYTKSHSLIFYFSLSSIFFKVTSRRNLDVGKQQKEIKMNIHIIKFSKKPMTICKANK